MIDYAAKGRDGIMVRNNNSRQDKYLERRDGERSPVRGRLTVSISQEP